VICTELDVTILHLAVEAVSPATPSIVDPVQALIRACPAAERLFTVVVYSVTVIAEAPVSPVTLPNNVL